MAGWLELRIGNAFLSGDSAGLATRDLCEGIGPAIRSGQRAAEAIVSGTAYTLDGIVARVSAAGWSAGRWIGHSPAAPVRCKRDPHRVAADSARIAQRRERCS